MNGAKTSINQLGPSASFSPLFGPNSLIPPMVFLVFVRGLRGHASGPLERPGTTRAAGVGGDDPCDEIMVIVQWEINGRFYVR